MEQYDGLTESPWESQKESQEDQGITARGGLSPSSFHPSLVLLAFLLALPWAPCRSITLPYVMCFHYGDFYL